jgi:hypothetical protein
MLQTIKRLTKDERKEVAEKELMQAYNETGAGNNSFQDFKAGYFAGIDKACELFVKTTSHSKQSVAVRQIQEISEAK